MKNLDPISLYVHWPWCKKKCPYCDFNSHVTSQIPEEEYLKALLLDLKTHAEIVGKRNLKTIFFGGGTPSLMSPKTVEKVIHTACDLFPPEEKIEVSLEGNPTSSEYKKFEDFASTGINRISIGMQALHDKHLQFLGREHSAKEGLKAVEMAQEAVNNVNLDMIYGLPEQSIYEWQQDLEKIISLGTQHISGYQLTIEPNTIFYSDVKKKKWEPMDDDTQADFFLSTRNFLKSREFQNYEISNFALQDHICRHNFEIWQYQDFIGIGAGAHGRIKTLENKVIATRKHRTPSTYMNAVKRRETFFYLEQQLSEEETLEEKILMGLRLEKGIQISEVSHFAKKDCVKNFIKEGFMYTKDGFLRLSEKGWPFLDEIMRKIMV